MERIREQLYQFLRGNRQAIIIGLTSFIIMFRPTQMNMYLIDYILCCFSINAITNWTRATYEKCNK